ncbi:MAG TPA: Gldg family protein [Kofleriaceae bacterium]
MIWTTAKKELRGYFNSSIALFFLFSYLVITIFTFFWSEKFFARGMADLRLMFTYTPVVMILLAAALSTRLWAEERRAGTIEILLTLPIPRWKLVVGKFVGGMLLIGIALVLTFGVPLTVAQMGNLDSGPVLGGYLATLLLAAAYLAIALCVSAGTDNPIVAFLGTAIVCGVLYAIGWAPDPLAQLGSGVRFESVARGVLDLRDLAYYAAIISIGLALNVLSLARMSWANGPAGAQRRMSLVFGVALVAANAVALILWLSPVHARIDMTRDGSFSLSPGTEKVIAGLDERVLIRGYFSAKTHPRLAPLIPQIRDMLDEYESVGHGKVKVELIDPDTDEAKKEAKERFGIDPQPLRFATQNEKSVVNAYFSIAIEYGDQHMVLGLDDLIHTRTVDVGEIEISLKNLEYALTRSIKKTVAEFSSVDALFAGSTGKVEITAYITPKSLPENWKDAPAKLQKVIDDLTKQAGGKLTFKTVEPTTDDQMRELFQTYGVRPYSDVFANQVYYFHILMKVGDRMVRISPPQDMSEATIKSSIMEGLKRAAPGFTHVVGIWTPPSSGSTPAMQGRPPQQMPPPQTFQLLQRSLGTNYELRDVQLLTPVPDDIDTLVLAGPADLDAGSAQNVDQFVMRGGALVVLAGRYRLAPGAGLSVEKVTTGLEAMFAKWGITVGDEMIGDDKNESFPVPVVHGDVRELQQTPYPYFVKFDGTQLGDSLVTNGLSGSVMHWSSPVKAEEKAGDDTHDVKVLLRTTGNAWLSTSTKIEPDLERYPATGFPKVEDAQRKGAQVVAVTVTGGFTSAYAKPLPKDNKPDPTQKDSGHLLEHSPPDARVVVFGSSAFASDDLMNLAQQLDSELALSNIELVHNAVDWSLADTDLMAIRARNSAAHAITMPVDERGKWPWINAILAGIGLAAVTGFSYMRRRSVRPVITGSN